MPLKSNQRQQLRARAHTLHPVVITGSAGLSDAVLSEINLALDHHELIKVRLNADERDQRRAMAALICDRLAAELVQLLGRVGTFYRHRPESTAT